MEYNGHTCVNGKRRVGNSQVDQSFSHQTESQNVGRKIFLKPEAGEEGSIVIAYPAAAFGNMV